MQADAPLLEGLHGTIRGVYGVVSHVTVVVPLAINERKRYITRSPCRPQVPLNLGARRLLPLHFGPPGLHALACSEFLPFPNLVDLRAGSGVRVRKGEGALQVVWTAEYGGGCTFRWPMLIQVIADCEQGWGGRKQSIR